LCRPALLLGGVAKEGSDTRQLACHRRGTEAARPPVGEEGSQIGGAELGQRSLIDQLALIAAEELDQPMCGRDIGADGVGGAASVVLEIGGPTRRKRGGGVN
jgi:hypothetical protein